MDISAVKLVLCPRSRAGDTVSHTGLVTSTQGTVRVLRKNGVDAVVRPAMTRADIEALIVQENPTHVVINALWLSSNDLLVLTQRYVQIQWSVLCHSNIAFLQAEPNAINLLHQAVDLELSSVGNFEVAANSVNGATGIQTAWRCPALYLPNLYWIDTEVVNTQKRKWSGGTLRIGAFGALRPLKNPTASAFAALSISEMMSTNLEFHINVGRNDAGWATKLLPAVEACFAGLPYAKLVKDPWAAWPDFRRLVRGMHLMLQPSFTESFNIVTADGVAEGVASVVSNVIEWAPAHWRADPDDTVEIARVGRGLLLDSNSAADGMKALVAHNTDGVSRWKQWLLAKDIHTPAPARIKYADY